MNREIVERFLSWVLPEDFEPDGGISFDGSMRPSGTNLFTYEQAEAMLDHVLQGTSINQTMHLADEVDKMVERFRHEYDLEYAQVVGVLMMKAHLLMDEAKGWE